MKKIPVAIFLITLSFTARAQWTASGANGLFNLSGNVGIGTPGPGAKLEVNDAGSNIVGLRVMKTVGGANTLELGNNFSGGGIFALNAGIAGVSNGGLDIRDVTNATSRMVITASGNVGMGTTIPNHLLTLSSGTPGVFQQTVLGLYNPYTANPDVRNWMLASDEYAYGCFGIKTSAAQGGNPAIGGLVRLLIDKNGNVGIGTTIPGSKLDVVNILPGAHTANTALLRAVDGYNGGANGQYFQIIGAGDGTNYTNINLIANYGYLSLGARADGAGTATNTLNVLSNGYVGIGTVIPDSKLAVNGTIHSKEVKVDMNFLPDYVFKPAYRLPTLTQVAAYIGQNHHLPDMPSAAAVAKDGLDLGDMNARLLKKVEELTLYLIDKDKQLTAQQRQISQLNKKLNTLIKKRNDK